MESISQPVARITLPDGETGVGFLIDACHLVTTLLLVPNEEVARQSSIVFHPNAEEQEGFTVAWQVKPGSFNYDIDRDVVLLELMPDKNGAYAGDLWGYFSLESSANQVQPFDDLLYLYYPEGEDEVESGQVLVTDTNEEGWLYYYGSWLLEGSCGAPLLNKDMRVVGVHSRKQGPDKDHKKKGGRLPDNWKTMVCTREMVSVA